MTQDNQILISFLQFLSDILIVVVNGVEEIDLYSKGGKSNLVTWMKENFLDYVCDFEYHQEFLEK